VARAAPRLLRPGPSSRLLLADPPARARHNRERFLELVGSSGGGGGLVAEECGERRARVWDEGRGAWQEVPIVFMIMRPACGQGDTVGVKMA
jgi:hypothetical protein